MTKTGSSVSGIYRCLILPTLLYFAMFALWSMNSPIGASPDEPRHIATAYSVTHGGIGNFDAEVPLWISELGKGQDGSPCYAWNPNQTADCIEHDVLSEETAVVTSQFGSYFPLYYLIVGLPTLFASGNFALIGMRLVSSFLCALILGLTTWTIAKSASSSSKKLLFVVPFTLVPMAVFLYGSVNSSAMEIASAVYFWCASFMLFSQNPQLNRRFLTAHFTLAALLLLSTRLLAPVWIIAIFALVGFCTDNFVAQLKKLLSQGFFRLALLTIGAFLALILTWDVFHPNYYLDPNQKPVSSVVEGVKEVSNFFLNSSLHTVFEFGIGQLGWGDTILPLALISTLLAWGALGGGLVFLSSAGKTLFRVTVVVAAPILASSVIAGIGWSGVGWQGRYSLPLLLGIPIALVFMIAEASNKMENIFPTQNLPRFFSFILGVTLLTLTYAYFMNYHRYSAGTDAFILTPNRNWSPTFPILLLMIALISAQYLLYRFTKQAQQADLFVGFNTEPTR